MFSTILAHQNVFLKNMCMCRASQGVLAVKNPPANSGDIRDASLIPGSGRSPGGGHRNPLQCSCLENPMDRGAWQATVHRVAKSWTGLKWLSTHSRVEVCEGGGIWEIFLSLFLFQCCYVINEKRRETWTRAAGGWGACPARPGRALWSWASQGT